jgi:hypothetical protein
LPLNAKQYIKISVKAEKAPDAFAKISKKSPFLVVVKDCCANSIRIPNSTEEIKINIPSLKLFFWFLLLKYKNHKFTNTK